MLKEITFLSDISSRSEIFYFLCDQSNTQKKLYLHKTTTHSSSETLLPASASTDYLTTIYLPKILKLCSVILPLVFKLYLNSEVGLI